MTNQFVIFILTAFLLGSLPTAYLAGRLFRGLDIRQHGSGNVGATNAFRVLGKKIGTGVFIIDFLKGFMPVFLAVRFFVWGTFDTIEMGLWIGLGAIAGHVFTPFLGFKGGKGIATGAGVLAGAVPMVFFIVVMVWIIIFNATRIVSLSSISALVALVISGVALKVKLSINLLFLGLLLFTIWTHRSNISRLIKGTEKKIN